MTPNLTAAVARLEKLAKTAEQIGGNVAGIAEDAAALRLVLDAVTPREGAEIDGMLSESTDIGYECWSIDVYDHTGERAFARVYGRTEAEALSRARAVAQVASREAER